MKFGWISYKLMKTLGSSQPGGAGANNQHVNSATNGLAKTLGGRSGEGDERIGFCHICGVFNM